MTDKTVRLKFYETIEEAKQAEPVAAYEDIGRKYIVLFELNGLYALLVHNEDRYYSSYLPDSANALFGGWADYTSNRVAEWEQIGNISKGDRDSLGDDLADFFSDLLDKKDDNL